ncbi:MAG: hypothetical protein WCP39_08030 [Chlamydiota bacterium]
MADQEKKCKHCAMMIPKEAKICPHCRKKQGTSTAVGCLAIFILLMIFAAIIPFVTGNKPGGGNSEPNVNIGEQGYLDSSGTLVMVAATKEALDAWYKAEAQNDKTGQQNLMMSGLILSPERGTKVLKLSGGGFATTHIRILEGEFNGQTGYVAFERVKKDKPKG